MGRLSPLQGIAIVLHQLLKRGSIDCKVQFLIVAVQLRQLLQVNVGVRVSISVGGDGGRGGSCSSTQADFRLLSKAWVRWLVAPSIGPGVEAVVPKVTKCNWWRYFRVTYSTGKPTAVRAQNSVLSLVNKAEQTLGVSTISLSHFKLQTLHLSESSASLVWQLCTCCLCLQTLSPADARLNPRTKKFHPKIIANSPSPGKYPLVLIQRQALLSGLKSASVDLQLPPRPPPPIHQHCPSVVLHRGMARQPSTTTTTATAIAMPTLHHLLQRNHYQRWRLEKDDKEPEDIETVSSEVNQSAVHRAGVPAAGRVRL
ncbi:hypothetical protein TYRP_008925 [Tyrophagus putrescentiae]|nr:hypothetical protein TYRP_008925 [Tyrophagus putrescentiae]